MYKFDKFCNQILEENYTITAREVLYRRYGKDVADSMIAKIKAKGKNSYLEKKYVLPNYSDANLDQVVNVIKQNFNTLFNQYPNLRGASAAAFGEYDPNTKKLNQYITLNTDAPDISNTVRELESGKTVISQDGMPHDILGHEVSHTLQNRIDNQDIDPFIIEITPMLGEFKRWYYNQTGIILDADATDAEINQFINYCKERDVFDNVPYGDKIDFEKLLRTSEGKNVFRRIVKQAPMKTDTLVA
jgi:hypothetical protein